MRGKFVASICFITGILTSVFSGESGIEAFKNTELSGSSGFQCGELVKGRYRDYEGIDYSGTYIPRAFTTLKVKSQVNELLYIVAGIDAELWDSFHKQVIYPDLQMSLGGAAIAEAYGAFNFGSLLNQRLRLTAGLFDFKYDPDAQNLGEYLFRSTTYPQVIWTEFGYPTARLLGFNLEHDIGDGAGLNFGNKVLFTSQTSLHPLWDWSITWLGNMNYGGMAELGVGVMFDRLVAIDSRYTHPQAERGSNEKRYFPNPRRYYEFDGATAVDSGVVPFSGTKVMARAAVDIKRFFRPAGSGGFFSDKDLKIYGEATLLGVKNYPWVINTEGGARDSLFNYNTLQDRIPIMFGINLPTNEFLSYCIIPAIMGYSLESVGKKRLTKGATVGSVGVLGGVSAWMVRKLLRWDSRLDLIAFEAEHWSNPYPNCLEDVVRTGEASPGVIFRSTWKTSNPGVYKRDDWKWSLYIRKSILKNCQVSFQAARDHLFPRNPGYSSQNVDFEELMRERTDWWWTSQIAFKF